MQNEGVMNQINVGINKVFKFNANLMLNQYPAAHANSGARKKSVR